MGNSWLLSINAPTLGRYDVPSVTTEFRLRAQHPAVSNREGGDGSSLHDANRKLARLHVSIRTPCDWIFHRRGVSGLVAQLTACIVLPPGAFYGSETPLRLQPVSVFRRVAEQAFDWPTGDG